MARGPEAKLSAAIVQVLRGRGAWAVKVAGGPTQHRGLPDIVASYRGYFIGLETKLPGKEGTLTKLQGQVLLDIRKSGGLAFTITSVRQADNLINAIDKRAGPQVTGVRR